MYRIRVFGTDLSAQEKYLNEIGVAFTQFDIERYSDESSPSQGLEVYFTVLPRFDRLRDMLAKLLLRPVEIDYKEAKIRAADIADLERVMNAFREMAELTDRPRDDQSEQPPPRED